MELEHSLGAMAAMLATCECGRHVDKRRLINFILSSQFLVQVSLGSKVINFLFRLTVYTPSKGAY